MMFLDSQLFAWVILPILIFCARIVDVSIGTLRILFIARNQKLIAPVLGFFESLLWLIATGQIFRHLDNAVCFVAYAGGFAMGNYIGMLIENRLAIGQLVVRIITESNSNGLIEKMESAGFATTLLDGESASGKVKILFSVIKRKQLQNIVNLVTEFAPKAFYTVEDVQIAREAVVPPVPPYRKNYYWQLFRMNRKRK
jgi:uncharacterized protein YebE (UPF0316 family)